MIQNQTVFSKDIENKKIKVVRAFNASLEQVWKAWTESEILDKWWAPRPYRAETKIMDFREGGFWLYAMIGPKGDISWCKENFRKIELYKLITNVVVFCDVEGNENQDFPKLYWNKQFDGSDSQTNVSVEINFDSVADLETIIKMGFREGFTAGLGNLEEYLSQQS